MKEKEKSLLTDNFVNLIIASVVGAIIAIYLSEFDPITALVNQNFISLIIPLLGASLFASLYTILLLILFTVVKWVIPYVGSFLYPAFLLGDIISKIISKIKFSKYMMKMTGLKSKKVVNRHNKNVVKISRNRKEKLLGVIIFFYLFFYIGGNIAPIIRLYLFSIPIILFYEFLVDKNLMNWSKYQTQNKRTR